MWSIADPLDFLRKSLFNSLIQYYIINLEALKEMLGSSHYQWEIASDILAPSHMLDSTECCRNANFVIISGSTG